VPRGDAVLWGGVHAQAVRSTHAMTRVSVMQSVMDGCGLGHHLSCAA